MIQDPIPTKIGWVLTKTTELATEVSLSEAIQDAKWAPRNIPDRSSHPRSFLFYPPHTLR